MSDHRRVGLFVMTSKGLSVLRAIIRQFGASRIGFVVYSKDRGVMADGAAEISELCNHVGVPCHEKSELRDSLPSVGLLIAVSWRWLISPTRSQQLVVLHDSLLPRYRGFAPLVNSLINGEPEIGVSAILAEGDGGFDTGPILGQSAIAVEYPITIAEAITRIEPAYERLAMETVERFLQGTLAGVDQDESVASLSPWLDEADYLVDWSRSAPEVRRFVDAVGFPYQGAASYLDGELIRIMRCVEYPKPLRLERPAAGKVLMLDPSGPCVACGSGAVILLQAIRDSDRASALPLKRFRSRFQGARPLP